MSYTPLCDTLREVADAKLFDGSDLALEAGHEIDLTFLGT